MGITEQWVRLLLGIPVSHIRAPVQVLATPLLVQFPANVPGRQWMMAQVLESLSLLWKIWTECLAPGFHMV